MNIKNYVFLAIVMSSLFSKISGVRPSPKQQVEDIQKIEIAFKQNEVEDGKKEACVVALFENTAALIDHRFQFLHKQYDAKFKLNAGLTANFVFTSEQHRFWSEVWRFKS